MHRIVTSAILILLATGGCASRSVPGAPITTSLVDPTASAGVTLTSIKTPTGTEVAGGTLHGAITITADEPLVSAFQPDEGERERLFAHGRGDYYFREGMYRGWHYRYFLDDGGAMVSRSTDDFGDDIWNISCETDAITDNRSCNISQYSSRLFMYFNDPPVVTTICVLRHNFPGRTAAIRVDKNRSRQTNSEGCIVDEARSLFQEFMLGTDVLTRRVELPYDYGRDARGDLRGLREAVDLMVWLYRNRP